MRKILLTLMGASFCFFTSSFAGVEGERFQQSEEAIKQATYGHVDAKGLKALIDSKTPFILLDARGHKWNDGYLIPGAMLASYEFTEEELAAVAPNPDALVVVYCFSFKCPLSDKLAKKLVAMGYINIVEYPGGLKEWRDIAEYPVDSIF